MSAPIQDRAVIVFRKVLDNLDYIDVGLIAAAIVCLLLIVVYFVLGRQR
jgi:uncharacterized protein YggT (Ycf19 family)